MNNFKNIHVDLGVEGDTSLYTVDLHNVHHDVTAYYYGGIVKGEVLLKNQQTFVFFLKIV